MTCKQIILVAVVAAIAALGAMAWFGTDLIATIKAAHGG